MSREGQCDDALPTRGAVVVCTFAMPLGVGFEWHTHDDHQLAWASSGVLTIRGRNAAWVLPPTRALWIPAGLPHETLSDSGATMRSAYVRPQGCPLDWTDCTPVVATALMAELIDLLDVGNPDEASRASAESLLVGLLEPVATATVDVRQPTDERARRVADALALDPRDDRSLASWGLEVGASGRTLARAFVEETGVPFGRWRAQLRVRLAIGALAEGESVSVVADRVGYASSSAFAAAFRRETGVTPREYFGVET